jgi:hypothetical protein
MVNGRTADEFLKQVGALAKKMGVSFVAAAPSQDERGDWQVAVTGNANHALTLGMVNALPALLTETIDPAELNAAVASGTEGTIELTDPKERTKH